MTAGEFLVLILAPALVLAAFLVLRPHASARVWVLLSAAILATVAVVAGWGGGPWIAATALVGGALVAMVWVLRSPALMKRPVLQALLALPVYAVALLLLVSAAVTLGLISP